MVSDSPVEIIDGTIAIEENIILTDVNFKVSKGDFIYLIGKTGSGKSTVLRTIYADLPLKKGSGHVAGFDLTKLRKKQIPYLRRKLGIVFQDFQLLTDRSVFANLEFVLKSTGWKNKRQISDRIHEVLEKVDLHFKDYKMPHQLSGGEQQRVAIARALLNDPELILADEPTGNLDPDTSDDIMELLFRISHSGRSVIMATHDYHMLKKHASVTYRCSDGKLINTESGEKIIDFESMKEM